MESLRAAVEPCQQVAVGGAGGGEFVVAVLKLMSTVEEWTLKPDSFTGNRRMRAHCPDSADLQSRKNRGRPTATTHPLTAKSHLPIKIEEPFRWAPPVGAVRVAAVVGNDLVARPARRLNAI
jgi:hypothetical protein